jgi:hypothetical protein
MLARIAWLVAALGILLLAFFFLVAAVAAGAVLAAALLARIWWVNRRMRKAAERGIVTAEYTVVEREALPRSEERHPSGTRPGALPSGSGSPEIRDSGFPPARE